MIDNKRNLQAVENGGTQTTVTPEVAVDSGITGAMGGTNTSQIVEQEPTVTVPPVTEPQGQAPTEGTDLNLGGNNYYAQVAPLTSSWENSAAQQQGVKFQQDVLAGKQTLLRSAQEAQAKGQEMQTQLALGEYMRGQSQEKAGWTGGYMLDQKRQGDYLKASIQAQMYGQQELQRYGMETQLEAARLAYDLGKDQLAYQLYQQEYQRSLQEANMFGYYVSPENRDMLNQYRAANSVLADANATEEEKARATVIKTQINEWFGEEDIDPNDLQAFSQITMEREQWNQAKIDAVLATINDDPSTFIARNPDGSYATDPATGQYIKLNFDDINSADLATFLSKDDGSDNKFADATFRSYAKFLAQSSINDYFTSLGEDGVPTVDGLKAYLAGAGADKLQAFRDKNPSLKATIDAILADNFSPSLSRNGVTITYTRDGVATPTAPGGTPTTPAPTATVPTVNLTDPSLTFDSFTNPFNPTKFNVNSYTEKLKQWRDVGNSEAIAGNKWPLTATELANQFVSEVQLLNKVFEKNQFTNYNEFAKSLNRVHNTFSNQDYKTFVQSKSIALINARLGFEASKVEGFKLDDSEGRAQGITIMVPQASLTEAQIKALTDDGYRAHTVYGKTTMQKYISRPDNVTKPTSYPSFTGWNTKYTNDESLRNDWLLFSLLNN
jgi:hypothetical protein